MPTKAGAGQYGEAAGRILKGTPGGVVCVVAVLRTTGEGSFDIAGQLDDGTIQALIGMLRQIADETEDTMKAVNENAFAVKKPSES